ncbi:riboflavin synthase [Marinomonas fungiae]|uniref:Riboflavin synthase n=1 Tax=Marinomonas fungiae TaxID=1137284 RepID=A0A0K6IT04_9GAMM|nr:riboflavin synthase [Marinomonas fungiae]CUB06241.1 riboflavin synthase alpha chain [Marinomonas fungiae]
MFTGIIEGLGRVAQLQRKGGDLTLKIHAQTLDMSDVKLGDSIATNGVCLTVTRLEGASYWADVSAETLAHTTLGHWQVGQTVNLEKALQPISRLGGHLVSGHVDAIGEISAIWPDARSIRYRVKVMPELMRYIALKGSICVDGISLTVTGLDAHEFELSIVPHTAHETIMSGYSVGTHVNVEVDQIARYLERLLTPQTASVKTKESTLTAAFLAEHGFVGRR